MKIIIELNDDFIKKNADITTYTSEELNSKESIIKLIRSIPLSKLIKCIAFNKLMKTNANEIILIQDVLTKTKVSTKLFESTIINLLILATNPFDNNDKLESSLKSCFVH